MSFRLVKKEYVIEKFSESKTLSLNIALISLLFLDKFKVSAVRSVERKKLDSLLTYTGIFSCLDSWC